MKNSVLKNNLGYSLFELIMVMIVISILMTVSLRYMGHSVDNARVVETKEELNQLADAIVGDHALLSGGHRIDYGYIGDIGVLPVSLSNLVTNPGLATWDGPYIHDDFYLSSGSAETEYRIDGWGQTYSYSGGTTISSTGGSTTITRELASNTDALLYNSVSLNIIDLDFCPPGTTDKDSVRVYLTYPNGLGSYQTASKFPYANGFVQFDSIPIGQQTLTIVELKNNDTLTRKIHVNPNSLYHADVQFPASLWCDTTSSGGGGSGVETLRPIGSGSEDELEDEGCSNNWQCVDETTSDGSGTYVRGDDNQYEYDLYDTDNSTISAGTIDSVIVYFHGRRSSNNHRARTYIRTNGSNYRGSQETPSTSYTTYSTLYINNPQSSSAWTWSEINAIQIGVGIRRQARVTQVWVKVYYTN